MKCYRWLKQGYPDKKDGTKQESKTGIVLEYPNFRQFPSEVDDRVAADDRIEDVLSRMQVIDLKEEYKVGAGYIVKAIVNYDGDVYRVTAGENVEKPKYQTLEYLAPEKAAAFAREYRAVQEDLGFQPDKKDDEPLRAVMILQNMARSVYSQEKKLCPREHLTDTFGLGFKQELERRKGVYHFTKEWAKGESTDWFHHGGKELAAEALEKSKYPWGKAGAGPVDCTDVMDVDTFRRHQRDLTTCNRVLLDLTGGEGNATPEMKETAMRYLTGSKAEAAYKLQTMLKARMYDIRTLTTVSFFLLPQPSLDISLINEADRKAFATFEKHPGVKFESLQLPRPKAVLNVTQQRDLTQLAAGSVENEAQDEAEVVL